MNLACLHCVCTFVSKKFLSNRRLHMKDCEVQELEMNSYNRVSTECCQIELCHNTSNFSKIESIQF